MNPIGGGLKDPTPLGWGYAGAPLVDGHQLVCVPGGKQGLLASLDKQTGKVLWVSAEPWPSSDPEVKAAPWQN